MWLNITVHVCGATTYASATAPALLYLLHPFSRAPRSFCGAPA
jgi:hypothetical protein